MNRKGFEFSFAWIFAAIVGAAILFLAVYAAVRFARTGETGVNTATAKQLSVVLEPMETGLASGKTNVLTLREDTRIYNDCYPEGFGRHGISLAGKSFGGKWGEKGGAIPVTNKYIFSDNIEEGQTVYLLSKPFEMPWKISELVFMTTKQYCFTNAPDFVKNEAIDLGLENVKFDDNCTGKETKVCFEGSCDIAVTCLDNCDDYNGFGYGYVEKDGNKSYYSGNALMYAAIFSAPDIYECNVKRLVYRLQQQASLFNEESKFLADKCNFASNSLNLLEAEASSFKSSEDLSQITNIADQVNKENDAAECSLW